MNNELAEYKRELVARSDYYRHAMAEEVYQIRSTFIWIPRTIQVLRWASPILTVATPVVGMLLGRRARQKAAAPPKKMSVFAKVMAGIGFYRKVKGIVDSFRPALRA